MELFDSHCHYNDEKFDADREEIISKNMQDGITKMVVVGYNLISSKQAIDIANKYKRNVCSSSEYHPMMWIVILIMKK